MASSSASSPSRAWRSASTSVPVAALRWSAASRRGGFRSSLSAARCCAPPSVRRSASMIGRNLRRGLLVLGPLRVFDNVGGGILGAAPGSRCAGRSARCSSMSRDRRELRRYAQDSTILSTLNEELPPDAPDRHARADRPVRDARRPGAQASTRPIPPSLDSAGVTAAALSVVRVIGNACGLGDRGVGLGRRRPASSSRTRTSSRESTTPHVDRNDGGLLDAPGRLVRQDQRHRRAAGRRR